MLCIYEGELTDQCLVGNVKRIMMAFPSLPEAFYEILQQRVYESKFTDERLTDAVNHVIDTCKYPTPTVAEFLSYNRHIQLYSYYQILDMVNVHGRGIFDEYKCVKIGDEKPPYFAHIRDIKKYKLELQHKP